MTELKVPDLADEPDLIAGVATWALTALWS
jgi:hypothetical protein